MYQNIRSVHRIKVNRIMSLGKQQQNHETHARLEHSQQQSSLVKDMSWVRANRYVLIRCVYSNIITYSRIFHIIFINVFEQWAALSIRLTKQLFCWTTSMFLAHTNACARQHIHISHVAYYEYICTLHDRNSVLHGRVYWKWILRTLNV